MTLITFAEVIDIIVMAVAIAYIFSDVVKNGI